MREEPMPKLDEATPEQACRRCGDTGRIAIPTLDQPNLTWSCPYCRKGKTSYDLWVDAWSWTYS
jgi:hypothetical protein